MMAIADFVRRAFGYLGVPGFNVDAEAVIFAWQLRQFFNIYVVKMAPNLPTTDGGILSLVVKIAIRDFFLWCDGGYTGPTAYTPALSAAKGAAVGEVPTLAPFVEDFNIGFDHLRRIAFAIATAGLPFRGALGEERQLKVKWQPFMVRFVLFLRCAVVSY